MSSSLAKVSVDIVGITAHDIVVYERHFPPVLQPDTLASSVIVLIIDI